MFHLIFKMDLVRPGMNKESIPKMIFLASRMKIFLRRYQAHMLWGGRNSETGQILLIQSG